MIKQAVENFEANKQKIYEALKNGRPESYSKLVKLVIEHITEDDYSEFSPDPERIHEIDDGDCQGTLVYVIAAKGYQPYNYWYVFVSYGSCCGCDTLQAIEAQSSESPPTEDQIKQYMTLALHIVQGLKKMNDGFEGE